MNSYKFKTKPWEHQLKALNYLYPRNVGALYTKMGSGKTKVMIDLIVNRGFKRILIVCPIKVCTTWKEEFFIHSNVPSECVLNISNLSMMNKITFLKEQFRMAKLDDKLRVVVINYESVWRDKLGKLLLTKTANIDCVICDESHRIKSPSSKCSRYLSKIGRKVTHRYLMTGTPIAEKPEDVYAQYRFLDPSIFGTNYSKFCEQYQNVDPFLSAKVGYTILDKKNPYKNLDDLRKKMFSIAFMIKPKQKLPKHVRKLVTYELSPKMQKLYNQLDKEGMLEIGEEFSETENVLALVSKLQQFTSGFIKLEDLSGKTRLKMIDYSRLNILKHLLKKLEGEPVVVFAKFRQDLKNIHMVCSKLGISCGELSGSKNDLQAWKEGAMDVLAVQYQSGSEGISLVRARYQIYYSLHHSYALYKQSLKRIHRPGQTRDVTYYHIVCKNTIDKEILSCLKKKQDIVEEIMKPF